MFKRRGVNASEMTKLEKEILNQEKILQILNWKGEPNPELFEKIVRLFLGQMSDLQKQLTTAAEQADNRAVVEIAHTLKSSSGTVGATHLMALCKQLELSAEQGSLDKELIVSVHQACDEVEASLNRELDKIV